MYSSVSNATWTADANLLGTMINTQGYDTVVNAIIAASPIIYDSPNYYDGSYNNYDGDNGRPFSGQYALSASDFTRPSLSRNQGRTSWFGAKAFINYLNSINYAGSNQWAFPSQLALPTASASGNPEVGQFGELFYNELGGVHNAFIPDTSTFSNEKTRGYWQATEYPFAALSTPAYAYSYAFNTATGDNGIETKPTQMYVWAVTPGNLTAVPVPGALWLFGTGLFGLFGLKRQRHA